MDNSDDYIVDDIVLDDQTLAALDQQEQKYVQESSVAVVPSIPEIPVSKRQKTDNGWTPGIGTNLASADSYDDLPEISLQGDGSYGFGGRFNNVPTSTVTPYQSRHQQPRNISVNFGQLSSTLSRNVLNVQTSGSRPPPSRQNFSINSRQMQNGNIRNQEHSLAMRQNTTQNAPELQTQMLELQKKLDELRQANEKIQSDLREALDKKLAKEGEVSILRKTIEKTSQSHASQISQLKSERERAEKKQADIQKDMKDEMERLRTQFLFKQQEFESSVRKPPGSVRAKKPSRDFPSTPLPAMSAWGRGPSQAQGSRIIVEQTPVRASRPARDSNPSPSKQTRKSPRKVPMLPGFENAFETSTPLRSPSKRDKGKAKANEDNTFFDGGISQIPFVLSQQFSGPPQSQPQFIRSQQESNAIFGTSFVPEPSQVKREDRDVVPNETDEDASMEEIEPFQTMNWKSELCRIILTHSHPSTGQITLLHVLGSSQFVDNTNTYSSCARILEVISNSARSDDYYESVRVVCTSFLSVLAALGESQQLQSLAILLNLLTKLVLSLPTFQSVLLSSGISLKDGKAVSIIDIICNVILENLEPTKPHNHRNEFAVEALSILQVFCFRVPQESMDKIEALVRNRDIIRILLHSSQPVWLLERSCMLLALLSTHHGLFRTVLDISNLPGADEAIKNAFIERLCSHLIDSNKGPVEDFKIYILIIFAQLSIAHPDAHAALVGSYALIPSLVLYISQLTTPLWEDDESLVSSVEAAVSLIQALTQTTSLLFHLVFGISPSLNLRHKLHSAPHRPFNSISHIFVVTFGRLGFCEAPSWIDAERRLELEHLAEIAREILEVVVDGPEGDSVWAAFEFEPDEEIAIDEEEMEARLMGVDMSN